jgi:hypothetical protein
VGSPALAPQLDRLEEAARWLRSDGLIVDKVYLRYTVCDSTTSICWQEVAYVSDGKARTASVRRLKRQQGGGFVQVLCVESWAGWRDR